MVGLAGLSAALGQSSSPIWQRLLDDSELQERLANSNVSDFFSPRSRSSAESEAHEASPAEACPSPRDCSAGFAVIAAAVHRWKEKTRVTKFAETRKMVESLVHSGQVVLEKEKTVVSQKKKKKKKTLR
eukprot:NODE_2313_length_487_cov_238.700913_g1897_i0.p3 GENE.NODE_2313_length_487_cov_238.700913_g1897_i0~~NODE_2313_length_487_cov_238.700913_g1897_i0.p3  ORF type:complete len:129 (-),score=38.45 NODE_2313_length_487_cov_238.700913_g1897_i0:5-391(-)